LPWKRHNAFLCTKTTTLWHVIQCRLVPRYHRFKETCDTCPPPIWCMVSHTDHCQNFE
jgi:hypothetical protein